MRARRPLRAFDPIACLTDYARLCARLAQPFAVLDDTLSHAQCNLETLSRARAIHVPELKRSAEARASFAKAFHDEQLRLTGDAPSETAVGEDETMIARAPTEEELAALPFVPGKYQPAVSEAVTVDGVRSRSNDPRAYDGDGETLPFLSDAIRPALPFSKDAPPKKAGT